MEEYGERKRNREKIEDKEESKHKRGDKKRENEDNFKFCKVAF